MKSTSVLIDKKIRGINVGLDVSFDEYLQVAEDILQSNPFQRKQVSSRGRPYALLRRDLVEGCIMPPIILSVTDDVCNANRALITDVLQSADPTNFQSDLFGVVQHAFQDKRLLILDGLQRTYTLQSCLHGLDERKIESFLKHTMRVEVYLGLSRVGILYRMLTLNTTQTPMSFRHQIEIMYHDHLNSGALPDGIQVVKEIDDRRARGAAKYKYSDVVDLYYAFTTGKPQSLDKQALVNQLAEMEFVESYKQDTEDLFRLLVSYNKFVRRVEAVSSQWEFPEDITETDRPERPFGVNVASIFEKVQPMTAFGAEVKRLFSSNQIGSFADLDRIIDNLDFRRADAGTSLDQLIIMLDQVAKKAPKIGPAQREYFQHSFRMLLNFRADAYLDLASCWLSGQERYAALNDDN